MDIKSKLEKAINAQINAEFYSSYLYLAMAAYFEAQNWGGFAAWMKVQSSEEYAHAMKLYNYVFERGGEVTLSDIKATKPTWKTPLEVFEAVYKHELKVTAMIHDLLALARKESDPATESMLQWFVTEQVEEEASAKDIVNKMKLIKGSANALFMLDQQLGKRQLSPASNAQEV